MHPTLRALLDRHVIVCVGPLVAQAAGLAGPRQLVDVCRGALGSEPAGLAELWAQPAVGGGGRLLARAEELLGGARFVRLVRPHLDRGDARPSLVTRALATLAPALPCICTTNLDATLERVLGHRWSAFETEPFDLKARVPFVMKLCGTASRVSTWVLGERQLIARPGELPQFGRMLRNHELLLVGYDVDDEPLQRLLLALRGRLGPDQPITGASVALVPAGSVTVEARALFAAHGVMLEPIFGDYDIAVAQWLHGLAAAYETAAGRQLPRPRDDADPSFAVREAVYPGLAAYPRHHARFFCGREAEVQRVQDLLQTRPRSRWLVVHGPDDIGKTSFISAGLLPALAPDEHDRRAGGVSVVRVRPGRRPLYALACELSGVVREDIEDIVVRLTASPHALTDLLVHANLAGVILVVEPLDAVISTGERDEREAFAAALAHAVAHAPDPFLLITGMTSERFGELYRLPQLHERVHGDDPPVIYGLAPLDADQLRRTIRVPATRAGFTVAARLVERILADVARLAAAADPPAPGRLTAMIAAALSETFRRSEHRMLCEDGYDAAGGLTGAIDSFAEAVIAPAIEALGEPLVRQLILILVGTSPLGRVIRRAVDLETFADECPGYNREQRRAQATRLLQQIGSSDGANRVLAASPERIVLVHDALLTDWTRLRRWVAEAQERIDSVDRPPAPVRQSKPQRDRDSEHAGIRVIPVPMAARPASPFALLSGRPSASQPYVTVPEGDRQHIDPRFRVVFPLPVDAILHPSMESVIASANRPAPQRTTASPSPSPPVPSVSSSHPTSLRSLVLRVGSALAIGGGVTLLVALVPVMWSAESALPEPSHEVSAPEQAPPSAANVPGESEGARALRVVAELLDAADGDPASSRHVASDLQRRGDEALQTDQVAAAGVYFERLLHFRQELVRLHPGSNSDSWNLAIVHLRLFDVSRRIADSDAALVHLQRCAEILQQPGIRAWLAGHAEGPSVQQFVDREFKVRSTASPPKKTLHLDG